jgi:hypothetical protein
VPRRLMGEEMERVGLQLREGTKRAQLHLGGFAGFLGEWLPSSQSKTGILGLFLLVHARLTCFSPKSFATGATAAVSIEVRSPQH